MSSVIEKAELTESMVNEAYAAIKTGDTRAAISYLCKSCHTYALVINQIMEIYRKALQEPSDS